MATAIQSAQQPTAQSPMQAPTQFMPVPGTLEDTIAETFAKKVAEGIAKAVFPNTSILIKREGLQVLAKKIVWGVIPGAVLVSVTCMEPFNYTAKLEGADATAVNKAYTAIGRVAVGTYDKYHVAVV